MDKNEARERLAPLLSPGDVVYTQVKHVSRSGMLRIISVHVIRDNRPQDITAAAGALAGFTMDRDRWGLRVGGCGMDMGFHVVYSLSRALWPNGHPCTGSDGRTPTGKRTKAHRCPSNDHNNGDRAYRKGKTHADGGYALNQAWL
jgi:hypothetical protein